MIVNKQPTKGQQAALSDLDRLQAGMDEVTIGALLELEAKKCKCETPLQAAELQRRLLENIAVGLRTESLPVSLLRPGLRIAAIGKLGPESSSVLERLVKFGASENERNAASAALSKFAAPAPLRTLESSRQ